MRSRAFALVAVAVVLLGGCGGKSSSDRTSPKHSSPPSAPTRASFVRQADSICTRGQRQLDVEGKKLFNSGQPTSVPRQLRFARESIIPSIERQVKAIKALTPPKGDEARIKALTDAADAGVRKLKANPKVLLRTQPASRNPLNKANQLAGAYGLKACGG